MKNIRVLTGITTSGKPHIGNLCGAILPAIKESKISGVDSFLFLADYHSLIKHKNPELTHLSSIEIAACWLACGLDVSTTTFYRQSDIPHIMELNWILSCVTEKGLLNRAHAYKSAVDKNSSKFPDKNISMGLYNYPLLMAADILMFDANIVPVGNDQIQHLEMTRDIAMKFNHYYGEIFSIPEARIDKDRGMLLGLDGQKMSKSYGNEISIFLDPEQLRKRIMKIKTNSLEPGQPKETQDCSIFNIYSSFASKEQIKDFRLQYSKGISWGSAKDTLFDLLESSLSGFRLEYKLLMKDKGFLERVLKDGASKALNISEGVITRVREASGIRSFSD